uniref:Ankyrin repeat-containing protein n=1 Tax=Populus alba TaxID=43335 RepID=A0A4V6ABG1_POPAL|nr:hypothetical protein D5086_0000047900 [Populus alba]
MGTPSEMKPAYIATLKEDWKSLAEFYEKHKDRLLTPMPFTKDTAFHMAVYCKDAKLLKCLLDSARVRMDQRINPQILLQRYFSPPEIPTKLKMLITSHLSLLSNE